MSRAEQRDARKLMKHLEIAYTHALRLLREGRYHLRDGQVYEGPREVSGDVRPDHD